MAKQTIGLGAVADDGTGDDLRTGGDKINDNFDELYAALAHPGYVAGRWYRAAPNAVGNATAISNANRIYFMPFVLTRPITISDLGCRVSTGQAASNVQLAIYAADAATRMPTGNPLAATGNISSASAGVVTGDITGADVTLQPGLYWMATNCDTTTVVLQGFAASVDMLGYLIGSTTAQNIAEGASVAWNRYFNSTFGTWPDMTSNSTTGLADNRGAMLFLKAA